MPNDEELNAFPGFGSSGGINWMQFTSDGADFDVTPITNKYPQIEPANIYRMASQIRWNVTSIVVEKTTVEPDEATQDVIVDVLDIIADPDLDLGDEQGAYLLNSLEGALKKINKGDPEAAIDKLNNFIRKVEKFVKSDDLPEEDGDYLIDLANDIIDQLLSL